MSSLRIARKASLVAFVGVAAASLVGCASGGEPYDPGASGTGGKAAGTGGTTAGSGGTTAGTGGSTASGTGGRTTAGSGGATGTGSGGLTGTGGAATGTGGAVVAPPTGTTLLFDDFDGSNTGPYKWYTADTLGTWVVATDGASKAMQEQVVTSSLTLDVGGDIAWTDVYVEAKVKFQTFTAASSSSLVYLAAHFVDVKDYYFLQFGADGSMKIRKKEAGSTTDLLSYKSKVPVVMGTVYTLGFEFQGSTVTAFLNGAAVMSAGDPAVGLPAGGIALGTQDASASFDDVKVTAP